MKKFADFLPKVENLLIVDLNSVAVDFYFQESATELADLDFSKLKKLNSQHTQALAANLLASLNDLESFLGEELEIIANRGHKDFKLIFLHSHEFSDLEREALSKLASKFNFFAYQLVERQFFYYQFLMQQKNFSKEKLLLTVFNDKLELFLFREQKLLFSRVISDFSLFEDDLSKLNFLSKQVNDFLFDFSLRKAAPKLEYLYVFDRGVLDESLLDELSRDLKLESIRTKNLC